MNKINNGKIDRTGETSMSNDGQKMTIVVYRSAVDIDIMFEDGTIVEHRTYHFFKKGKIKNPNYSKWVGIRIGEKTVNVQGAEMKICSYTDTDHLEVEFADGYKTNGTYSLFKEGKIYNPNLMSVNSGNGNINKNYQARLKRIGESIIAKNGQRMTIIAYRTKNDIDIEFEDGTIVEHKRYGSFKKGQVFNPNCPVDLSLKAKKAAEPKLEKLRSEREGMRSIASNGMEMELIKYVTADECIVRFLEDGYECTTNFLSFTEGIVFNPNFGSAKKKKYMSERNGLVIKQQSGLDVKILNYKNALEVDVEIEDGTKMTTRWEIIKNKALNHPMMKNYQGSDNFYGYKIKKVKDVDYFYKVMKGSEFIGVMTLHELLTEVINCE